MMRLKIFIAILIVAALPFVVAPAVAQDETSPIGQGPPHRRRVMCAAVLPSTRGRCSTGAASIGMSCSTGRAVRCSIRKCAAGGCAGNNRSVPGRADRSAHDRIGRPKGPCRSSAAVIPGRSGGPIPRVRHRPVPLLPGRTDRIRSYSTRAGRRNWEPIAQTGSADRNGDNAATADTCRQ